MVRVCRGNRLQRTPEETEHRMPARPQYVFLALCLGLAAFVWFGHARVGALISGSAEDRDGANGKLERPVTVVVARVGSAANTADLEAVGSGRAKRSVLLVPEAPGEIVNLPIRAGDYVARGDIILELDRKDVELALSLAQTRLIEVQRLFDRSEKLRQSRVNSQANVDDAQSALARAQFEVDQAKEALRKRTLVAPFDGVVGIPRIEQGDRVTVATEIVSLDDRRDLYIEFEVPERYLSRISAGQTVLAFTPGFGTQPFDGRIDQIDSRVDLQTRSVAVRAVVPNADDMLRPGMSFAVHLALPGETYPVVPELALVWVDGRSIVWAVRNEAVEQVPVDIVRRLNSRILVEGPLATGELVVVEGVQRLRPGKPVKFAMPGATSGPLTN